MGKRTITVLLACLMLAGCTSAVAAKAPVKSKSYSNLYPFPHYTRKEWRFLGEMDRQYSGNQPRFYGWVNKDLLFIGEGICALPQYTAGYEAEGEATSYGMTQEQAQATVETAIQFLCPGKTFDY